MLNQRDADAAIEETDVKLLEGISFGDKQKMNTTQDDVMANIIASIRRGHPQVRPQPTNYDQVALVCGGPSLNDTVDELRDLYFEGAQIVTVNGAYQWAIERNLMPKMQIVLDARPGQTKFLEPYVERCRYVLASQCHPEMWDAVADRENVWIFHAVIGKGSPERQLLEDYYAGQWYGVGGGTTVMTRALSLLRMLGYLRFHLFGADSCWMDDTHHAYAQAENDADHRLIVNVAPTGVEGGRQFVCAPWHLKQAQDFLTMLVLNGRHFKLEVHGDGLLAYMLLMLGEDLSGKQVAKIDQVMQLEPVHAND